jgi:two-component system nitrate/nitrite response regulator NarL
VTVRLVLADDHPLLLDGLESLFSGNNGYRVQARCSSGQEALEEVRRSQPDILILELHMSGVNGVAVARAVKEEGIPTRIVILTAKLNEREALDCLRAGVAGIVLKDMASSLLLQCVDKVAAGDVWVEKRSFSRALEHLLRREAAGHVQRRHRQESLAHRGDGQVSSAQGLRKARRPRTPGLDQIRARERTALI